MVTVAVIGCGRIAQGSHLPALAAMENVRLKYVCDLIEEKAVKMKETYPDIENVITDYKIALNDHEVEAVYVLTPNYAHYTISMDAMRAGKHVFCEKPITVNYALSCEMAEEAKRLGRILNIGVCNRFNRSVEILEQMNREGKLGELYHVYCSFRSCRNIPGLGGDFTTKSQSGGGVLIDWGVHFFDLILYILGGAKLKNLTCDTYSEMAKDMKSYKYRGMWAEDTANTESGTNDVEDYISGYIRTDKASISFNGAWAQNLDKEEMYIDFLGDKCGVRFTYMGGIEVFDGSTLETSVPEYDIPSMYACEDAAFIESVQTGEKNRQYIDNVLETAKLLEALYSSADKREEVKL